MSTIGDPTQGKEYRWHVIKCPYCDFSRTYEVEANPNKDKVANLEKLMADKKKDKKLTEQEEKDLLVHINYLKKEIRPKIPSYANAREVKLQSHLKTHFADPLGTVQNLKDIQAKHDKEKMALQSQITQLQTQLLSPNVGAGGVSKEALKLEVMKELATDLDAQLASEKDAKEKAKLKKDLELLKAKQAEMEALLKNSK